MAAARASGSCLAPRMHLPSPELGRCDGPPWLAVFVSPANPCTSPLPSPFPLKHAPAAGTARQPSVHCTFFPPPLTEQAAGQRPRRQNVFSFPRFQAYRLANGVRRENNTPFLRFSVYLCVNRSSDKARAWFGSLFMLAKGVCVLVQPAATSWHAGGAASGTSAAAPLSKKPAALAPPRLALTAAAPAPAAACCARGRPSGRSCPPHSTP